MSSLIQESQRDYMNINYLFYFCYYYYYSEGLLMSLETEKLFACKNRCIFAACFMLCVSLRSLLCEWWYQTSERERERTRQTDCGACRGSRGKRLIWGSIINLEINYPFSSLWADESRVISLKVYLSCPVLSPCSRLIRIPNVFLTLG